MDTILPAINQLSYLPGHARRYLPAKEYNQTMSDLAGLLAEASAAVYADRDALAARMEAAPAAPAVSLRFYATPRHWQVRCASPLAHALLKLLQDLIALDEEWAEYAWNADQAQAITPNWQEISQVAAYENKYREWLQRLHRLRQDLRVHLNKLRQAAQPQAAAPPEEACPANGRAE